MKNIWIFNNMSLGTLLHVYVTLHVCLTEDPKAYMKQFLEKLRDARTMQRNYPCIFDDSNVRSLFGMLDVTGKGFITYEQYKQGQFFFYFTISV